MYNQNVHYKTMTMVMTRIINTGHCTHARGHYFGATSHAKFYSTCMPSTCTMANCGALSLLYHDDTMIRNYYYMTRHLNLNIYNTCNLIFISSRLITHKYLCKTNIIKSTTQEVSEDSAYVFNICYM